MIHFRTILHPTDFSESAMYAFGVACALARVSDANLLVVHVAPSLYRPKRQLRRENYEALCRLTCGDSTVKMHPLLLEGDIAPNIVSSAIELDCDLIVMGTSGRTGARRLLLGSVAVEVRKDAPCPVVAVQLPNRAGWELPDFADAHGMAYPSSTSTKSPLTHRPKDRSSHSIATAPFSDCRGDRSSWESFDAVWFRRPVNDD
ncbi:universal stress protein [Schlesneria paludicola]|uniref:universal stress protein n=1 Tax=Schlesneria paludicola TaxID=360056 RepID=UPI000299D199